VLNVSLTTETEFTFVSDRLILGFISKEDARNKLLDHPLGTFLLRFSETNIVNVNMTDPLSSFNGYGYLTIAVNEQDPYSSEFTFASSNVCFACDFLLFLLIA